ncbi:hypothetical protein BV494_24825 (plasmid) [Rahnella sikkimica]|uniref:Uncharacterized protein n=1 Tax=Rahnella sikkimica TaxID=1805933 RepID=A0A2L1UYM3_9GAMM|nr:hypothetical protein BV494_24120 [Rahnella sikkimica]AVF38118.1 hypothetical protein BV494_24825 [Rahnella sikkimica]
MHCKDKVWVSARSGMDRVTPQNTLLVDKSSASYLEGQSHRLKEIAAIFQMIPADAHVVPELTTAVRLIRSDSSGTHAKTSPQDHWKTS